MIELKIYLDYDPKKFIGDPEVGIGLERLKVVNGVATAKVEPGVIFYVTGHFVVKEKKTSITYRMEASKDRKGPPKGYRVRFRDNNADLSAKKTYTAGIVNRDYFKFFRVYLEVKP